MPEAGGGHAGKQPAGTVAAATETHRAAAHGATAEATLTPGQLAWFIYGALLKQGSTLSPSANVARILFGTWWVFITIVTAFYTAQLTVVLATTSRLLPVNNLVEINQNSAATWVAVGGGALGNFISLQPSQRLS